MRSSHDTLHHPNLFTFTVLSVPPGEVRLFGHRTLGDSSLVPLEARLKAGQWKCSGGKNLFGDDYYRTATCDNTIWMLNYWSDGIRIVGGGTIPTPPETAPNGQVMSSLDVTAFSRRCPNDAWLATLNGVWELKGRTWQLLPEPEVPLSAIWKDDSGLIWAIGGGDSVVRLQSGAWEKLVVPKGFEASMLFGEGGELWFFGAGMAYRWTGDALDGRMIPLAAPKAAWMAPDGTLWVGGATCRDHHTHGTCGEKEPEGVLLRLARLN